MAGNYQSIANLVRKSLDLPTITSDTLSASGSCYMQHPGIQTFMGLEEFIQTNKQEVEWKCPWCGIINFIEATYCGEKHEHVVGCGQPRARTRQET